MPAKLERCVKEVNKKIKKGEIPKTYKKGKKKKKTSAWAICTAAFSKKK